MLVGSLPGSNSNNSPNNSNNSPNNSNNSPNNSNNSPNNSKQQICLWEASRAANLLVGSIPGSKSVRGGLLGSVFANYTW